MTDFGISKEGFVGKDVRTATVCGTPEYFGTATPPGPTDRRCVAHSLNDGSFHCGPRGPLDAAPELLEGKGYGKEVDWWSFGTLLYEMLTGQPPFFNDDRAVMYSKIMHEKLQLPSKIGEVKLHHIILLLLAN
jgi:serine/threonine protein kinase